MSSSLSPGVWLDGVLPVNAALGSGTVLIGDDAFKRFQSKRDSALVVGMNCTLDGVQLATGTGGHIEIGDYCHLSSTILLAEVSLRIGSYVIIGWNTTIADCDFHPMDPALRIEDAIACYTLSQGRTRPPALTAPIDIGDNVFIGPCVAILKGVRIGERAFIEPGSVVTRDVPARARVLGNPARIVGEEA